MRNIIILGFLMLFICVNSQERALKGKKYREYKSIYNSQLKCLGVGTAGSYNVEVGVSQRKKKPDFAKARKGAVFSVLFNGFPGNYDVSCDTQEPILNADAFESNPDYFESFFETGKYAQFVSSSNDEFVKVSKLKKGYKIRLKVVVRYDDLREKMEKDGLRKGLGSFFKN